MCLCICVQSVRRAVDTGLVRADTETSYRTRWRAGRKVLRACFDHGRDWPSRTSQSHTRSPRGKTPLFSHLSSRPCVCLSICDGCHSVRVLPIPLGRHSESRPNKSSLGRVEQLKRPLPNVYLQNSKNIQRAHVPHPGTNDSLYVEKNPTANHDHKDNQLPANF